MKVYNPTDDDLYVAAVGDVVPAGGSADVPKDIAEALVLQGWTTKPSRSGTTDKAAEATPQED